MENNMENMNNNMNQQPMMPQQPVAPQQPQKDNDSKRYLIIGIIVVLVAVIAGICALVFGGKEKEDDDEKEKTTYETPIKECVKLINDKNAEYYTYSEYSNLKETLEFDKYYDEVTGELEEYEDIYQEYIDELESIYGDDYKLTYNIDSKEKCDEDTIEDMKEYFNDIAKNYEDNSEDFLKDLEVGLEEEGLDSDDIEECLKLFEKIVDAMMNIEVEEAYEMKVTFNISGSDDEDDFEKEILTVKLNGKWVFMTENDYEYSMSVVLTPRTVYNEVAE